MFVELAVGADVPGMNFGFNNIIQANDGSGETIHQGCSPSSKLSHLVVFFAVVSRPASYSVLSTLSPESDIFRAVHAPIQDQSAVRDDVESESKAVSNGDNIRQSTVRTSAINLFWCPFASGAHHVHEQCAQKTSKNRLFHSNSHPASFHSFVFQDKLL